MVITNMPCTLFCTLAMELFIFSVTLISPAITNNPNKPNHCQHLSLVRRPESKLAFRRDIITLAQQTL